MKKFLLLGLLSASSLLTTGCDNPDFNSVFQGSTTYTQYKVRATDGSIAVIGDASATPPTPHKNAGQRLGMHGDHSLCASVLSSLQKEKADDIIRRLNDLIERLQTTPNNALLPGEKRTIAETPDCERFQTEIDALAARLLPPEPTTSTPAPADKKTEISNMTFGNEGHGWIVMNVTFADGRKAVFDTAHKVEELENILNSTNLIIPANVTNQAMGLQIVRNDFQTNTTHNNFTRTCTYFETRNVCTWNPQNGHQICQVQQVPVSGWQNVQQTITTNSYQFNVNVFTQAATVAANEFSATIIKRYEQSTPCFGSGYPGNPSPFPYPGHSY